MIGPEILLLFLLFQVGSNMWMWNTALGKGQDQGANDVMDLMEEQGFFEYLEEDV